MRIGGKLLAVSYCLINRSPKLYSGIAAPFAKGGAIVEKILLSIVSVDVELLDPGRRINFRYPSQFKSNHKEMKHRILYLI